MSQQQQLTQSPQRRHMSRRGIRTLIVLIVAVILLITAVVLTILNIVPALAIFSAVGVVMSIIIALAQWLLPVSPEPESSPSVSQPVAPPTPIPPISIVLPPPTPAPAPVDDDPHLWSIPYQRNPLFTGREALLTRLHLRLTDRKTAALTQAISGLGGIGKTQTAIEYAYRHRDEYHVVAWLRAESRETLIGDLSQLARLLNLPALDERDPMQMVAALMRWCTHHERWLFIYDNYDHVDEPQAIADLLPTGGRGHVILTTRAHTLGALAVTLDVEVMDKAEGAELLLRRAGILTENVPLSAVSVQDHAQAETLTEELGGLPLALDQAAAYIQDTGCGLDDYLTLYRRERLKLLGRRDRSSSYPETVATTWSLSFKNMNEKYPDAAALLTLCAFLDPDVIQEEMLTVVGVDLGQPLTAMLADVGRFNEAVEVLFRSSLIRRNRQTKALSLHRLVQVVQQESMPVEEQRRWAERAVCLVWQALPEVDLGHLRRFQKYLAQTEHCAALIERYDLGILEAAHLLHTEGLYLYYTVQYQLAEDPYQHALTIKLKTLGEEHPDTATTQHALAGLYEQQGKYQEAEVLYQRALQTYLKQLGEEHSDTATTQQELAGLYRQQGKYREAEVFYQRALQTYLKQLGEEHPDTAATQHELAVLYRQQGKYLEAEALYQRALWTRLKQLGEEHPDTATTQHALARLYEQQGRYQEAEALYQRALQTYLKQLGEEHPRTAITQKGIGALYVRQGKYQEAEELYKQALRILEKMLGDSHPETLVALENYADFLRTLGRDEEAEVLEARVHVGEEKRAEQEGR